MEHYAGIDVSLEYSSVCVVDASGKIVREGKVASEPEALIAWFASLGLPVARIAEIGRAGLISEPERQKRSRMRRPVDGEDAASGPMAKSVGVAGGEDLGVAFDVLAPDVEPDQRIGHAQLALERLARLLDRDALAAHDAVQVAHRGPQALDVVPAFKPVQNVRDCIAQFPAPVFLEVL